MVTRRDRNRQGRMVVINLDDYVKEDDILREIDREVDTSFVNEKVEKKYSNSGRGAPPEDPERMFRQLIGMVILGIRSERQLEEATRTNLRMRWFAKYDIDEKVPDHSTISKARKRFGVAAFDAIFTEILEQCIENGYVGGELSCDRTDMSAAETPLTSREQALILTREVAKVLDVSERIEDVMESDNVKGLDNSTKNTVADIISDVVKVPKKFKRKVVKELLKILGGYEEDIRKDGTFSAEGKEKEEIKEEHIKKEGEQLEDLKDKRSKGGEISGSDSGKTNDGLEGGVRNDANKDVEYKEKGEGKRRHRRKGIELLEDWKIEDKEGVKEVIGGKDSDKIEERLEEELEGMSQARAGTDARFGHTTEEEVFFGYNAGLIVDHKKGIITSCDLSQGNSRGNERFPQLYEEHKERCGIPKSMRMDSEYDTNEIRDILEEDGVTGYITQRRPTGRRGIFRFDEFKLDENGDLICPCGKKMKKSKKPLIYNGKEMWLFRGVGCKECKLKGKCTKARERTVKVNLNDYNRYLSVKAFNKTEEYKREMKRRLRIEARIGHGKTYHCLAKARYRDIDMIKIQLILIATALNMERMVVIRRQMGRKMQTK